MGENSYMDDYRVDAAKLANKKFGRSREGCEALSKPELGNPLLDLAEETIQLRQRLENDSLTNLRSRAYLNRLIKEITEKDEDAWLLFVDVDHFKTVNDEYGHDVGDIVLSAIAQRLRSMVQKGDCVGRYGGEEMLIIMKGNKKLNLGVIEQRAEELRKAVEKDPFKISGKGGKEFSLTKTISIGVAQRRKGEDEVSWIKRADQAMYQAKKTGRNKVVMASL